MAAKILIRGGLVVDPARNMFTEADICVENGKVVAALSSEADAVINAGGCLVLPGLIDYHTHLFYSDTSIGIKPDLALLPQGVTTAVDQGSAGFMNAAAFLRSVIACSQMRLLAYLHVSPAGLATLPAQLENADPALYNQQACYELIGQKHHFIGLKIRQSQEIVGSRGLEPLKATLQIAEQIGCPVVVHTTNPPAPISELVALLRPGDVFTHVYQGQGHTILNDCQAILPTVLAARRKGVVFDTADGRGHYSFAVAKAAIAAGFLPDIISTDLVRGSLFADSVFGLPLIMSKYLALGLSVPAVVGACTANPAKLLGMPAQLGTLAPGACADIALFKLKAASVQMQDIFGETVTCSHLFVPQMTILHGEVVYRNIEY